MIQGLGWLDNPKSEMDACCSNKEAELAGLRERQRTTLLAVLVINAAMFVVELVSGLLAGSMALVADSLDMLGDALVYGFSLYVVDRADAWKARAAFSKAAVMGAFGILVAAQLAYKLAFPETPAFQTMGVVGTLALVANSVCAGALWRHRADDINMRSVWLCSRNDLIANSLVLAAACGVWISASPWPDLIAGGLICTVFLRSSWLVAREARAELSARHYESVTRNAVDRRASAQAASERA